MDTDILDNSNRLRPSTWVLVGSVIILFLYVLSAIGHYFPQYLPITGMIITPNIAKELGIVELSELVLWFSGVLLFIRLALTKQTFKVSLAFRWWCVFFAILCFVALGEEASWGQHLGFVEPSEELKRLNAQGEFNFHNLNVATLLGIDESNIFYPYLNSVSGVSKLLNPLFYAFCGMVWFVIPMVKRSGFLNDFFLLRGFPVPESATSWFVFLNLMAYLIVDKTLFDVSECLELAMSMAALFVPLDLQRRHDALQQRETAS